MSRKVKKSLEKNSDIENIIDNLLKINKLKLEEFLLKVDISLDSYRKAVTDGRDNGARYRENSRNI